MIITYEKLLEYLELGVKEQKILDLLKDSPTTFTLGKEQIEKLRAAGASETLLEALKKNAAVPSGSDISVFVLILDCSGSMKDKTEEGITKFEAAQKGAIDLLTSIPNGREVAFIVYGTDAELECKSVDVLRPLSPLAATSRAALIKKVRSLSPVGHTPIALSLRVAGKELQASEGMSKVILITDGLETCHGDPAKEASALRMKYKKLKSVDVIGLGLTEKESAEVAKIAKAGAGTYFNAKNVKKLQESVRILEKEIAVAEEPLPELTGLEKVLVEQLRDKDREVRTEAARTLAKRKAVATVPYLVKRVADDNWVAGALESSDPSKDAALEAVLELAAEKGANAIIPALNAKRREMREWAAKAITKHKLKGAVPALVRRILDDNWSAGALESSDPSKDAALDALKALASDKVDDTLTAAMKSKNAALKAWATKKIRD
jgi:hypothetical protein